MSCIVELVVFALSLLVMTYGYGTNAVRLALLLVLL